MAKKNTDTNERELVSRLTEWFNENIYRNRFPFKEATNEVSAKFDSKTYFGDIVLWASREARNAYAYIEIKPPFAAKEDKETLRKKALRFNVKYCFTWDFQNFNAYEIKGNKLELHSSETTPVMNDIADWLRGDIQTTIKKYIYSICEEIIILNDTGKFRKFVPDKVYFVNYIREAVNKLVPQFEKHYTDLARDKANRNKITAYGTEQGLAYKDPTEYYKLLARQSVYNLVTKIIFYLTVRRYFTDLPDLYSTDQPDLEKYFRFAFAKAQEKDWQAVFEESEIEQFGIPKSCHQNLSDFFSEMKVYHFGELPEDVIGELFEDIIDPKIRHSLGQYFTNENLVDFILGFVVNEGNGIYADPTCGSGTFLIRLYDRLKYLSKRTTHKDLLDKIWGFDIAKFPAELATINLFKQDVSNFENFPRVRRTDIFEVNKGDAYDFPPPSASKNFKNKVSIKLPGFNAIVGNFPFIRQELIAKEIKTYKFYLTKVLAYNYFISYPKLFIRNDSRSTTYDRLNTLSADKLKKEINALVDNGDIQLKLSGQADIYAYIFIHTATLLAEKGQFAIITSNSWLDVSYGSILKEFFLDNFNVKAVIGSWAEPWFEDAAVNTIVTILEKEEDAKKRKNNITRFVKLKKKFTELIPYQNLRLESIKRWQRIDWLVDLIENAENNKDTETVAENISSLNLDEMRIRLIKQSFLEAELAEKGELAKWGKYLRAPDVYFEIIDRCKDKLIPLKDIAEVRFGIKTGINEFFYLEVIEPKEKAKGCVYCRNGKGWEGLIEEKYLRPVIKSPKESESITIDIAKLKFKLFLCNSSKADLRKQGDKHALKYIEWGERQRTEGLMFWKDVPSVQSRKYWWSIEHESFPEIIFPCGIGNVYKVFDNSINILNDKRLYEIYTNGVSLVKYLISSTLFSFFIESDARVNLGDGLLDLTVYEVAEIPLPKIELFNKTHINKLENIYNRLSKRDILNINNEVKQKDKIELDTKILKALGLDAEIYLPKIYEGLCEVVKERLELPQMRKKKQKDEIKYAFDKVKEDVIADCLPEGAKEFPNDFYSKGNYDMLEFETYPTNGQPLKPDIFFNNIQMKTEEGDVVFVLESEAKAEFAGILSQKPIYQIKIPAKETTVEQILKNYHNYIKNLKEELEANSKEKVHDWAIAEKMAKEILEDFGLK